MPRGAIAGIVISPKLVENTEAVATIRAAFHDKVSLLGVDGQLLHTTEPALAA